MQLDRMGRGRYLQKMMCENSQGIYGEDFNRNVVYTMTMIKATAMIDHMSSNQTGLLRLRIDKIIAYQLPIADS